MPYAYKHIKGTVRNLFDPTTNPNVDREISDKIQGIRRVLGLSPLTIVFDEKRADGKTEAEVGLADQYAFEPLVGQTVECRAFEANGQLFAIAR